MKKSTFLPLLLALLPFCLQAQKDQKIALEIRGGTNYGDPNYGYELFDFENFFPVDDYTSFRSGNGPLLGYQFGLGADYRFLRRFTLFAGADYVLMRNSVDGAVGNRNPNSTRPPSNDFPMRAEGFIHYSFIDLQAGLAFTFNERIDKGLYAGLTLNYLLPLNVAWQMEVEYEAGATGTEADFGELQEPDYNGFAMLGLELGYKLPLLKRVSLTPYAAFRYGLSPFVEEQINPTMGVLGLKVKRWFGGK